jgi:N-acetylglutamate synthase/N-acetylornithine aminotransferase
VSNRLHVTPEMLEALRKINHWCGRDFALTPVSNTVTRQLAKLGWVDFRVTKVHSRLASGAKHDGEEKTNIVRVRITRAGEGALAATSAKAS